MQTIQELLARDEGSTSDSSTAVQYISTVEAYDKWAEVCLNERGIPSTLFFGSSFRDLCVNLIVVFFFASYKRSQFPAFITDSDEI